MACNSNEVLAKLTTLETGLNSRLTAIENRLTALENRGVYIPDRATLEAEVNAIGITVNIVDAIKTAFGLQS